MNLRDLRRMSPDKYEPQKRMSGSETTHTPNLIKSSVIGKDKDLYWKSKNTNYKVKNMGFRLTACHEKYPGGWIAVASE